MWVKHTERNVDTWSRLRQKHEVKWTQTREQRKQMGVNSEMAVRSLILSPWCRVSPAIRKVTVHPTGKHSLQAAITSDCISLHNLETLFTQPKTLQSSGEAGQSTQCRATSFSRRHRNWHFFVILGECYNDGGVSRSYVCDHVRWSQEKSTEGIKPQTKVMPSKRLGRL